MLQLLFTMPLLFGITSTRIEVSVVLSETRRIYLYEYPRKRSTQNSDRSLNTHFSCHFLSGHHYAANRISSVEHVKQKANWVEYLLNFGLFPQRRLSSEIGLKIRCLEVRKPIKRQSNDSARKIKIVMCWPLSHSCITMFDSPWIARPRQNCKSTQSMLGRNRLCTLYHHGRRLSPSTK
jgi:hypothetical protein